MRTLYVMVTDTICNLNLSSLRSCVRPLSRVWSSFSAAKGIFLDLLDCVPGKPMLVVRSMGASTLGKLSLMIGMRKADRGSVCSEYR